MSSDREEAEENDANVELYYLDQDVEWYKVMASQQVVSMTSVIFVRVGSRHS